MPRSTRKNLEITSVMDMISKLSNGNMGAMTVLIQMAAEEDSTNGDMSSIMTLLSIDDLNMRDEQIYVAFKECGSNIKTFVDAMGSRDPDLIAKVNVSCPRPTGEQVFSGASYHRSR